MEEFFNCQFNELLGSSFLTERSVILKLSSEIEKNSLETVRLIDELTGVVKNKTFLKLTLENLDDDIDFYVRVKCTIFVKPNKIHRSFILLNHTEIAKNKNETTTSNLFEIPDDFDN